MDASIPCVISRNVSKDICLVLSKNIGRDVYTSTHLHLCGKSFRLGSLCLHLSAGHHYAYNHITITHKNKVMKVYFCNESLFSHVNGVRSTHST